MAECGLPPELGLHLLECPICLERLQQPKSLPCLHSFCQDCLGTYITKELSGKMASSTSFTCPVCRRMTPLVNQAQTKDKWAEQFPTISVTKDLIQLRESSSEPLYCKPCQTKEIALQSISDLRKKVDTRLDKLQKDITDELIIVFKEEKREMEASLLQCERLMNGMLNTLKSSI
ncbi:tripartite motif containing 13-like [Mizuhopecten yessoensis]|uniref:tripartite motif containing 13-like n=1 Tax=Mizuhopecten yessoensis TaxID=6573 RepID=UPI000B45B894|nr:tripartite motif containing 13-like [Mizuhopecten yessoensis]